MAGEWTETTWGEIATLQYGKGIRDYTKEPSSARVFGTNGPVGWHTEKLWDGPGVIVGRKGAYRGVHYTESPYWVIDTAYSLQPKANIKIDLRWAYYQIRYLDPNTIDDGSPIPSTTRPAFYAQTVRLPDILEQRAIANLLGSLDDKIALNVRTSETIETMALALFKNWMNVEGNKELVTAQSLIDTRKLEIGDGYRAKNDELGAPGLPFIRAANLNRGIDTRSAEIISEASVSKIQSKISIAGDVAFTSKGTVGRFARVDTRTPTFVYSPQVCFWRSIDSSAIHPSLLYLSMKSPEFIAQIMQASGETDMAPYVSLQDQRKMTLPVLPQNQASFGEMMHNLLDRQALLDNECYTLATLRDTLLPRLISGDLRIRNAERAIAAA